MFVMHGLHYGSPNDICSLTERLQKSDPLSEELAALVRSMVLREGGSMPRTDLLEIVAIAIAGPRMDPAGEELQPAVKQLLSFLHAALRRPWNEPPGEERLHPDEDPRAEAARELREAAAKIEAEVQGATRDRPPEVEIHDEAAARAVRANVIPFGRARAVFSRLARAEAAEPMDDDEMEKGTDGIASAAVVAATENQIPQLSAAPAAEITDLAPRPLPIKEAAEIAVREPPPEHVEVATSMPVAEEERSAMPAALGEAPVPTVATSVAQAPAEPAPEMQPLPTERKGGAAAVAENPKAGRAPALGSPIHVPRRVPSTPVFLHRPDLPTARLPEFDEEPPLPAAPRVSRVACAYGIAAVVLLGAVLGFALRNGSAAEAVADASSRRSINTPAPVPPRISTEIPASLSVPMPNAATSKPTAAADSLAPQPAHSSHFDDDYVAPPYTTTVAQPGAAAASVPARPISETSGAPPSKVEQVSARQDSEPHFELARPRDPDASIVGDGGGRTSTVALAEPPPHPHISAGLMAENLVSAPKPDYPALAKIAHVDGPVVLHAEINRKGEVSDTQVISGHFLLRRAAEAAVKHWRYRPYQVDGKSVPVSTTITVRFRH